MDSRLNTRLRTARIDNNIRTRTEFALPNQPGCILLRADAPAHELMRRRILQRKLNALLVDIHSHNLAGAIRLRDRTAQQTHGASTKHHNAVPGLHARRAANMHRDGRRLDQRALLHAHVLRQLVAQILGQAVVARQRAVVGRRGCERHLGAEVVFALLAAHAAATGDAGLHGDAVADLERRHFIADGVDDTGGLVAQDHGRLDDEGSDAAVNPVVHVGSANAGPFGLDEDVVGGGEGGDGAVFVGEFVDLLEDEGGVLARISLAFCEHGSSSRRDWYGILNYVWFCARSRAVFSQSL